MRPDNSPSQDSIIQIDEQVASRRQPFYVAQIWQRWFDHLIGLIRQSVSVVRSVAVPSATETGGAAIVTTAIATLTSAGVYRVSYVLRITQAATVSSSATVTIGWVCNGVALTFPGAAVTGNLTTSFQSLGFPVRADALTDITYAVAYASVGATSMLFSFDALVESVV